MAWMIRDLDCGTNHWPGWLEEQSREDQIAWMGWLEARRGGQLSIAPISAIDLAHMMDGLAGALPAGTGRGVQVAPQQSDDPAADLLRLFPGALPSRPPGVADDDPRIGREFT